MGSLIPLRYPRQGRRLSVAGTARRAAAAVMGLPVIAAVVTDPVVGIGNANAGIADGQGLGRDANSCGYYIYSGVFFNGTQAAYFPPYGSGARLCHALDLDNHLYWVRVGPTGNWNNSPSVNPATDTGGFALPASFWASAVGPAVNLYTPSDVVTGYFTPQSWIGTAPSGFGHF